MRRFVLIIVGLVAATCICQAQWIRTYNGPSSADDLGRLMATDASGNVYVTGTSYDPVHKQDIVTVKYDSTGTLQWTRTYGGQANDNDVPNGLAVDSQGNVYVAGAEGTGGGQSYALFVKYTSAGADAWVKRWNFGHTNGRAVGFGIDAQDNPYFLGTGQPDGEDPKFWLYKMIKADGNAYWGDGYRFAKGDTAVTLKVDPDGSTYLAATSKGSDGSDRIAILKHDTAGTLLWKYFYQPAGGQASPSALAVDSAHNVYFTGSQFIGNGSKLTIITGKLKPNGLAAWTKVYSASGANNDLSNAIAAGPKGDVFVVGWISTPNDQTDILTLKYSPDGLVETAKNLDLLHRNDYGTAVSVDSANRVHVLGAGLDTPNKPGAALVHVTYNGASMAQVGLTTTGDGTYDNVPTDIKSDGNGHLWMLSSNTLGMTGYDYVTNYQVAPPVTFGDAYYVNYSNQLSKTSAYGVLANDVYVGGGTAVLDSTTSSGVLNLQPTGAFIYTPGNFFGVDTFKYHAQRESLNGASVTVLLTVVAALESVSASPSPVKGGINSVGTVHLNHTVGTVYPTISCSSSNPAVASVPATFQATTGNSKTFTITTHPVAMDTNVIITAKWNGITQTTVLKVTH